MDNQTNTQSNQVQNTANSSSVNEMVGFLGITQQNVDMDACRNTFSNLPADSEVVYFYTAQNSPSGQSLQYALVIYVYREVTEDSKAEIHSGNPYKIAWEEKNGTMATTPDLYNRRMKWLSYLEYRKEFPIAELPDDEKKAFNIMLAAGYWAALTNTFEEVENAKKIAFDYVWSRLLGRTRHLSNKIASIAAFIALALLGTLVLIHWQEHKGLFSFLFNIHHTYTCLCPWIAAALMGIVGAFVSIWNVNKETEVANYFKPEMTIFRTCCRLLLGIALAIIAAICYHKGVINFFGLHDGLALFSLLGFMAGYSERWIMGIVDKLAHESEK